MPNLYHIKNYFLNNHYISFAKQLPEVQARLAENEKNQMEQELKAREAIGTVDEADCCILQFIKYHKDGM